VGSSLRGITSGLAKLHIIRAKSLIRSGTGIAHGIGLFDPLTYTWWSSAATFAPPSLSTRLLRRRQFAGAAFVAEIDHQLSPFSPKTIGTIADRVIVQVENLRDRPQLIHRRAAAKAFARRVSRVSAFPSRTRPIKSARRRINKIKESRREMQCPQQESFQPALASHFFATDGIGDTKKQTLPPQLDSETRLTRRANALLLLDDGMSCAAIAKVLYLDDDTIRYGTNCLARKG